MANRSGNNGNIYRLYFLGLQITMDSGYSHEIKRCLLFGRKAMNKLDSILKTRDITLPRKVCLVKAMVFPVVMYRCENWTIGKVECQRTDAFKLWCWKRLLRVPWTARRWNQSIRKEINPEHSLEGLALKPKLQYFSHLIQRANSLRARGEEGGRGRDVGIASPAQWTWIWANFRRQWRTGKPGGL